MKRLLKLVGIGLLLLVGLAIVGAAISPKPTPEQVAEREKTNKEAGEKKDKEQAAWAAFRAAKSHCKAHLKYPDDSTFVDEFTYNKMETTDSTISPTVWAIRGKVNAPNGFGAKLTVPWSARVYLDPKDNKWGLQTLIVDGKTVYNNL